MIEIEIHKLLEKRVFELEKQICRIRDKARNIKTDKAKYQYVLENQPIINQLDTEINLIKPLYEFYDNLLETIY